MPKPTVPPGQDPNRVPPGQDPNRVPPGQDPNRVPPGQEKPRPNQDLPETGEESGEQQ